MAITPLETQNMHANPKSALEAVARDLYTLQHDVGILSWACDQLWHHEFGGACDMEFLSHFPIAVLRGVASRTAELHAAVDGLTKGGVQ